MSFPPVASPADELADADVRRHVHQLIHPELAAMGQRRLKNGRVLVIGADEVGAPALGLLADAGVGTIGVVDTSPLHVWDLHLGRPRPDGESAGEDSRAVAWATALRTIHPSLAVEVHETRLTADNVEAIIGEYDVVLCANEDPALCHLVDDACARLGTPHVWAGIDRDQGQVAVFWEPNGPGLRDLYPSRPAPYFRGVLGVLKVMGTWLASAMVTETVKLLVGAGEPLVGRVLEYDAMAGVTRIVPLSRHPEAERPAELTASEPYFGLISPEAAAAARDSTISVVELRDLMDGPEPIHLVDVREPEEFDVVNLPGSVLIPNDEFLDGDAAARMPMDRKVVLLCRMGIRSAEALAVVKAHGHPDAVHVGGGIIAWAQQIDPSMPTY